uniref:Uncharacterized protein n=1 Tax=Cacopsylla melanoneura TaxID=428564 RepID=A0A8D8R658_9HEMI
MDNSQGYFVNLQQMVGDKTGDDVSSGQDTGAQNSQEHPNLRQYMETDHDESDNCDVPVDTTLGVSSDNFDESGERKRKKVGRKAHWIQEHKKYLRNTGQSYVTYTSSKVRRARQVQPPCSNSCRLRCFEKFTPEQRQALFRKYWDLGDIEQQRLYIAQNLDRVLPKYDRRTPDSKRFLNTAHFFDKERVCQAFFLNTLDITQKMVRTIQGRMENSAECTFKDSRGGHQKKRLVSSASLPLSTV